MAEPEPMPKSIEPKPDPTSHITATRIPRELTTPSMPHASPSHENICLAILGPVSAGKSTLLNALFANTYSEMRRKKTTMLPQIYQTSCHASDHPTQATKILEQNTRSNREVLASRDAGTFDSKLIESIHYVCPIDGFITIPDPHATYQIIDMPGLNCGGGDDMYYKYLDTKAPEIDIYVLVFDLNTGLGTTDEIRVLEQVNQWVRMNPHSRVHVLINKSDGMRIDRETNEISFDDDELDGLYRVCVENVHRYMPDSGVRVSPICASSLYVYRGATHSIGSLDEMQIDKLIREESGKKELGQLKTRAMKENHLSMIVRDQAKYDELIWATGYGLLCASINQIIGHGYRAMIDAHIARDMIALSSEPWSTVISGLSGICDRLTNLTGIGGERGIAGVIRVLCRDHVNNLIGSFDWICVADKPFDADVLCMSVRWIDDLTELHGKITQCIDGDWIVLQQTIDKIKELRIKSLNASLRSQYNEDVLSELVRTRGLDWDSFEATCKVALLSWDVFDLLDSIVRITGNRSWPIDRSWPINRCLDAICKSSRHIEKIGVVCRLIEKICELTTNDIEMIGQIIEMHIKAMSNGPDWGWILWWVGQARSDNQHIQYLYYRAFGACNHAGVMDASADEITTATFDDHCRLATKMQQLDSLLHRIFGNKPAVIDLLDMGTIDRVDPVQPPDHQ
jgi:GTP-binding protein EngB required for normal cell division